MGMRTLERSKGGRQLLAREGVSPVRAKVSRVFLGFFNFEIAAYAASSPCPLVQAARAAQLARLTTLRPRQKKYFFDMLITANCDIFYAAEFPARINARPR
jgi:hypothetical protein